MPAVCTVSYLPPPAAGTSLSLSLGGFGVCGHLLPGCSAFPTELPVCHLCVGSAPESWPRSQHALLSFGLTRPCPGNGASLITKYHPPQLLKPGHSHLLR